MSYLNFKLLFFFIVFTANEDAFLAQTDSDDKGYGDLGLPIIILDGTAVLGLGFLIGVCCACVLLRKKEKIKGRILPMKEDQQRPTQSVETVSFALSPSVNVRIQTGTNAENRQTNDSQEGPVKKFKTQLKQTRGTRLKDSTPTPHSYEEFQNRTDAENIYDSIEDKHTH
ncbi:uncharacterized protein LOC132739952 isoform X2 [Ruditapes philippinarum]|uniref:uncharacterized protein LOC132739952 isoform X2 n=1 Tax=Ruditapes philippinarum TaxID=129788 RepID=UPI00295A9BDC|nr:uncharacterized protein LOC132739952 isoform X2 [Ruditapes philippinarum]